MITNITINNDVDLYYQLNIDKNNKKSNKNNIEIKSDDDDLILNIDLCEYEKMFDDI